MTHIGWFVIAMLAMDILFTALVFSNHRYARKKYKKPRYFRPNALVIVPCKGLDENFQANMEAFCRQDYKDYRLWFVVESEQDSAYRALKKISENEKQKSQPREIRILCAGKAVQSSQKLHNLLYAVKHAPPDTEVFVFADSDVHPNSNWLAHIVAPLRKKRIGLATGYRWFVPKRNTLANLTLSAINAKVCQLMGNTRFNLAWGGSMAVRRADFERLNIAQIWKKSLSDDLTLSQAVRQDKLLVRFAPACLNASVIDMDWPHLLEFARRQFLITRIYAPKLWWFGLLGSIFSILAFSGGWILLCVAFRPDEPDKYFSAILGFAFLACPLFRAICRQKTAQMILSDYSSRLRSARWFDIGLFWLCEALMLAVILSSAFGRTIQWRSVRYTIRKPEEVVLLSDKKDIK